MEASIFLARMQQFASPSLPENGEHNTVCTSPSATAQQQRARKQQRKLPPSPLRLHLLHSRSEPATHHHETTVPGASLTPENAAAHTTVNHHCTCSSIAGHREAAPLWQRLHTHLHLAISFVLCSRNSDSIRASTSSRTCSAPPHSFYTSRAAPPFSLHHLQRSSSCQASPENVSSSRHSTFAAKV